MDVKQTARILSTITTEQWEAILTFSKQNINFKNSINQIANQEEEKIIKILNLIGISPYSKGYEYFKDAIIMYKDNENERAMNIYFQIAQKHNTTTGAVKAAIDRELKKANKEVIEKMGVKKITPSKVIAVIAKHIKNH